MKLTILYPSMTDNDNITPANMDVPSENHNSIADGINRIAESLGATAVCNPVLTQMTSSPEATRFVISLGIRWIDREVKPIRSTR